MFKWITDFIPFLLSAGWNEWERVQMYKLSDLLAAPENCEKSARELGLYSYTIKHPSDNVTNHQGWDIEPIDHISATDKYTLVSWSGHSG